MENNLIWTHFIDYPQMSQRDIELVDQSLIKTTKKIMISTGTLVELFEYQKPVYYNFSPRGERSYEKKKKEKRREDSVYRARANIKRIVDGNAWCDGYTPIFITFTFGEHITEPKDANKEWSLFVKRINFKLKRKLKYLTVIEFQKQGRVHYHVLYFDLPYIENIKTLFSDVWGNGFVNIKTIKDVVHLGGYVSKYLTKENIDKKLVGQKAFFCSRNISKPQKIRNEVTIDNFFNSDKIELTYETDYKSESYGLVRYSKYKHV